VSRDKEKRRRKDVAIVAMDLNCFKDALEKEHIILFCG
jgi:hypothetical protein